MKGFKLEIIKAPVGAIFTYCYVLETAHMIFMIDSAVVSSAPLVDATLDALPGKRLIVLNTHGHWDHTGLNGHLQKTRGALTAAHRNARKWMTDKDFHFAALYGGLLSQCPYDDAKRALFYAECGEPSLVNISLSGGEIFEDDGFALEIIHTPGHSGCSICMFERFSKTLFCGDSLQGQGVLGNLPFYFDASDYRDTVLHMAKYDAENVYGGHCRMLGQKDSAGFLKDSVSGFEKNDATMRAVLDASDRRSISLCQVAGMVAEKLGVINNVQAITVARAHMKYIDEGI